LTKNSQKLGKFSKISEKSMEIEGKLRENNEKWRKVLKSSEKLKNLVEIFGHPGARAGLECCQKVPPSKATRTRHTP
jgi:hypothetical protein